MHTLMLLFFQFGGPVAPITDPNSLLAVYQGLLPNWIITGMPYATHLFWGLAAIEFGWLAVLIWRQFRADDPHGIVMTVWMKVCALGFFLALLQNGPVWVADIVNSFETIGKASTQLPQLGPAIICALGLNIAAAMLASAGQVGLLSLDSILAGLAILPAAALVLLSFGAMAVYFVMVKIQTFIAMGATIVFLGFGGSEFTRSWVYKYIDLGISSGVKLMLIYFLVGAGWNLATAWIVAAQTAATSPSGVISCWIILIGALCYAAIAIGVPQYAAGLLSGNASLGHGEAVAIGSAGAGMAASAVMTASGMGVFGSGGAAAAAGASIAGASSPSPAPTAPPSSPPGGSSNGSGGGAYAGSAPAGGIISGMGGEFAGPA